MNPKRSYQTAVLLFCVFSIAGCSLLVNDLKNLNRSVSYQIENYLESASTDDFTLEFRSEAKIGYPQDEVPAEREGFSLDEAKSGVFKENGSTYVRYYYRRNLISLKFKSGGGIWIAPLSDSEHDEEVVVSGKYEADVVPPDTTKLIKENYNFKGWDSEIPEVFPLSDETFTAEWDSGTSNTSITDTVENDITLEKIEDKSNPSKITFTVKTPYSGDWTYEWLIDKTLKSDETSSSMTQDFSSGSHEITVIAKEGGNVFSKSVSVQIKEAGNEELN